jgi:DNA-binding CsgD family transcriptional regulator
MESANMAASSEGFPPEDPPVLQETDARAIVRLLGEVCALPGGHAEKKRALMDGLAELTGADCWIWCFVAEPRTATPPVLVSFTHGGFTEERFARFLAASQHPGSARNTATIIEAAKARRTQQTRLREQLIPTEEFHASSAYPAWCEADIDGVIVSLRQLDDVCQSAVGLYRSREKPPFAPRESRLAHILLSEVPWLHELGWPEDRGVTVPRLSPRQRLTLNLLLDGRSRPQIAADLAISPHTADSYVKEIYRHFGVHSQAELIRRFQRGDGGDRD